MSIFGKKGGDSEDAALEDQEFGDPALDDMSLDAGAEDAGAPAADEGLDDLDAPASEFGETEEPLAAPSRKLASAAGGGRRNLLILLLLLVLAGLGGGYFYFMGGMPEPPQPAVVKATVPQPAPAKLDKLKKDAEKKAADGMMPAPLPGDAGGEQIVPPADPFAAVNDPLALEPVPGAPPQPGADPLAGLETAPAAPPQPAPADADAQADPLNLGAPPADEAAAAIPAESMMTAAAPVAAAPDEQMPEMPPPEMPQPGAEVAAGVAAVPAPAPAAAPGQGEDLPMPVDAATGQTAAPAVETAAPKEEAPAWAAPGNPEVPGTTNPLAKTASPSEAELAIVQSAAVLDNMAPPKAAKGAAKDAGKEQPKSTGAPFDPAAPRPGTQEALEKVGEIIEKPAVIRPIPSGYMVIRKDSEAGDVDSRLTAARVALAQNRTTAALELFDDLKKDFPKDRRALMGRAVALQKLGQNDEALAAYEDVLRRDPKNLDALTNMLGLLKAKDPMLAIDKLLDLRNAYPYQGDITAQLGIAYATAGRYDEALKYLEMADALKPGSSYVMYNRAVLYDKMGRSRDAGALYRQLLRMAADGELDQQLPLDAIRKRLAALH